MVQAIITPRSPIAEVDQRTGTIKLTREGFLFLDNLNRTVNDFAATLIIDAITDGITDQAPSSNAVFDALALKADASSLSDYLSLVAAAAGYQPLDSQLTSIAALADAAGVLTNDGAGALSWAAASSGGITLGTPTAATSGTTIDYTGLPAGVKEVNFNVSGLSTNGTSSLLFQLGSGSVATTGYVGSGVRFAAAGVATATSTAGLFLGNNNIGSTIGGTVTFRLLDSTNNIWAGTAVMGDNAVTFAYLGATTKALSGALDRIRLTSISADTFDAGTVNYSYSS